MMNDEKLKQIMATMLEVEVTDIGPTTSMDTLPNWDSLRHMNLVLAIEEEFAVQIPDEDAGNITSYELIQLVLRELMTGKG